MSTEELIIRWIARTVVCLYLVRLLADLTDWINNTKHRPQRARQLRTLWTFAFGLHVLHILLAFAWIHHWSHAHAYEVTAQRTEAVVGWYWGGGVWINHLFLLWWLCDILISWRYGFDHLSPRYVVLVHLVTLFFVVNATVVFGPSWWTPVFGLVLIAFAGLWWKNRLLDRVQKS